MCSIRSVQVTEREGQQRVEGGRTLGELRSSQRREAACRVREDKYLLRAIAVILRSVRSSSAPASRL